MENDHTMLNDELPPGSFVSSGYDQYCQVIALRIHLQLMDTLVCVNLQPYQALNSTGVHLSN